MGDVWRMSAEDAEEFTRALGQIMSGGWRQIALAQRLGVPEAIGMTTESWVRERIGGYIRLGLDERREAVRELTDPAGEFQLSQRQAAEVLGVDHKTVGNDLRRGEHSPPEPDQLEAGADRDGEHSPPGECEAAPAFAMPEQEEESEEERAYYALSRQRLIVRLDPARVAETAAAPEAAVPGFEEFERWLAAFVRELRSRRVLRSVK